MSPATDAIHLLAALAKALSSVVVAASRNLTRRKSSAQAPHEA